jgi:hypothetical protein
MDDRERLQRYLEWRERTDRPAQRAVRRRRIRSALVGGAAVGVVGIAGFAWISHGTGGSAWLARHDASATAGRVTDVARADVARETHGATEPQSPPALTPPPVAASTPPPVIERTPAGPPAPRTAARRTSRAAVRTTARGAAAPPPVHIVPADESTAPSAATSERVAMAPDATPGVGGESTPTVVIAVPSTPPPGATPTAPPPPVAAPPQLPPSAQDAPDAPGVVSVPPAPGTITSIESKPDCPDVTAADSPDGRTRGQRVADCAGGWLKGQSKEFRDGVKREADDFRTGLDRVGRGLQWLGSKLRRPE